MTTATTEYLIGSLYFLTEDIKVTNVHKLEIVLQEHPQINHVTIAYLYMRTGFKWPLMAFV